jgi:hypothetical protein
MRTKVAVVAVFAGVGLIWLYVGSPTQRFRMSEEDLCRDKCTTIQKSWRLVPQHPKGMVPPGKYDGPWSCECY